jgi:large subunit ribosomal protein L14
MIQSQTRLRVADNCGGKKLMCICVLGANKKIGRVGDTIIGVIKQATPNLEVRRSDIVRAVIVRTSKSYQRSDGSLLRFGDNSCIVLNGKTVNPQGTRVFGPIGRELKDNGFSRIVSLPPEVL